ncbi:MAG: FAD-dependent oxidoreductase [Candidatus Sumerlaeota bacterium]|nr:FAD-dependent oxidoreductase [Candidatus Sumerlaeota bacterium]
MTHSRTIVLGAGMTGLGAGWASGLPVYEADSIPGGVCASYYVRPGGNERLDAPPPDGEAYRFEVGGGHWIFGGEPLALRVIRSIAPTRSYERKSSVYFPGQKLFVPYPLQNHLRCLPAEVASRALAEISESARAPHSASTMAEWLRGRFGPTLCERFFDPFHALYTARLWRSIAPQDAYKSPIDLQAILQGAKNDVPPVGYNATFLYPEEGLDALARNLAARCEVHYEKRATAIDVKAKEVHFADGSAVGYDALLSTLPLSRAMELAGLQTASPPDPYSSVLVVNVGARKTAQCPADHWIYVPESAAGFHRVGFYSHVDPSFLPRSARRTADRASIYVKELQHWGWIEEAEAVSPTWIDVAYTWSWPGSRWKQEAQRALEERSIYPVGRYARWSFQGIADSLRDGLLAGAAAR